MQLHKLTNTIHDLFHHSLINRMIDFINRLLTGLNLLLIVSIGALMELIDMESEDPQDLECNQQMPTMRALQRAT